MLKLENIEVYYGHVHALKGVSLEVREGELVSLLGANGAGKTTTLMTISGIIRPRKGTVTYLSIDLTKIIPEGIVIQGIVQCPEGRRIFGSLNVMENLRMGAVRRKDRDDVKNDLEWVFSLFPVLKTRIHQTGATLSGGEQQMLAIGRALMAKPRLLMLDEPSLGLAPLVVQEIFKVIQQLHQQGVTILLVEQNARQAMAIADRCYLLETGQVALSGTAAELKSNIALEQFYLGGMAK
ncbi:MAG: ABC transporter ATP-binding protein [Anaerolineales bacterium]|jgi:branched-chain amino acid transport system ATP-binding protein